MKLHITNGEIAKEVFEILNQESIDSKKIFKKFSVNSEKKQEISSLIEGLKHDLEHETWLDGVTVGYANEIADVIAR